MAYTYCPGQMISSSRGLSLFFNLFVDRFLFVGSHVTMQYKYLPLPIVNGECLFSSHIAFISRTQEYKLVCHCKIFSAEHRWFVLFVGNNMSWRRMELK
ncbi:unnamed protein product [Camellia sinensis]